MSKEYREFDQSRCNIHMHRLTNLELEVAGLKKQLVELNGRLVNLARQLELSYVVE